MKTRHTVKLLSGMGSRLIGQLLMMDGRDMAFNAIALPANPQCPVCRDRYRSKGTA